MKLWIAMGFVFCYVNLGMMKSLLLILVVFSLSATSTFRPSIPSGEAILNVEKAGLYDKSAKNQAHGRNPEGKQGANTPSALGEAFVFALSEKKFDQVVELMPGVEQWKLLSPEMTEGLDDDQIAAEIKAGNIPALKVQFETLVEAARKKHIKIKEIDYNETVTQRYFKEELAPVGLVVSFFYDHNNDRFHLQAVEVEKRWYLLKIMELDKAFQNIPDTGQQSLLNKLGIN